MRIVNAMLVEIELYESYDLSFKHLTYPFVLCVMSCLCFIYYYVMII